MCRRLARGCARRRARVDVQSGTDDLRASPRSRSSLASCNAARWCGHMTPRCMRHRSPVSKLSTTRTQRATGLLCSCTHRVGRVQVARLDKIAATMANRCVVDARNILDKGALLRRGFSLQGGRPQLIPMPNSGIRSWLA